MKTIHNNKKLFKKQIKFICRNLFPKYMKLVYDEIEYNSINHSNNVLFLIGNGFDLHIGMQTKYEHFYDYYLKQTSLNAVIQTFKSNIRKNIEDWADLELKLGEYLESMQENEAISIYDDLIENLRKYIQSEESRYDIGVDSDKKVIYKGLKHPENYLNDNEKEFVKVYYDTKKSFPQINIISFNYTTALDKLLSFNDDSNDKCKIGIEHIHGLANQHRMIIGVNDITQIKNDVLKGNAKIIKRYIKSECNVTYGMEYEERCISWINEADIMCIYGLSLGDTDAIWWNRVARRLLRKYKSILIIFCYDKDVNQCEGPNYEDKVDDVKEKFLSKVTLNERQKRRIFSKIHVSFRQDIFDIKLNLRR